MRGRLILAFVMIAILLGVAILGGIRLFKHGGSDTEALKIAPVASEPGPTQVPPHDEGAEEIAPVLRGETDTAPFPEPVAVPHERPKMTRPNPATIPVRLRIVMGVGEEKSYLARVKAVQELGKDLSCQETQALYSFLYRKEGDDHLPLDELNALKNEAVNILRAQRAKPTDLAQHLMTMHGDTTYDIVWRDYCIQHLGSWFRKVSGHEERQQMAELLWQTAERWDTSMAGTALIALSRNTDESEIDVGRLTALALGHCQNNRCEARTKSTALYICAKFSEKHALPVARDIAGSKKSVPLRMSAIATVGALGDPSDRPMLEKLASSSDYRLRTSAKAALKRLGESG